MSNTSCAHQCPMFDTKLAAEMLNTISGINRELGEVHTKVEDLKHTLLGNGNPGKCQLHDAAIDDLKREMQEGRGRRHVLSGVISAVVALSIAVLGYLFKKG